MDSRKFTRNGPALERGDGFIREIQAPVNICHLEESLLPPSPGGCCSDAHFAEPLVQTDQIRFCHTVAESIDQLDQG